MDLSGSPFAVTAATAANSNKPKRPREGHMTEKEFTLKENV
jgi:hypothetical protein